MCCRTKHCRELFGRGYFSSQQKRGTGSLRMRFFYCKYFTPYTSMDGYCYCIMVKIISLCDKTGTTD